jgi:hypothetical protein
MLRRALLVGLALSAAFATAAACDDGDAAPTSPADGGIDATEEVAAPLDADLDASDAGSCRAPSFADSPCAKDPKKCQLRTLYLATKQEFPFGVATDTANVYWIAQAPRDGGADAGAEAVRGQAKGTIRRVSKKGDATQAAVDLARDQDRATVLVLDGPDLYWIATSVTAGGEATSTLRRVRNAASAACSPACPAPEDVATFPAELRRLVRVGSETFFAVGRGGQLVRFAPGQGAKEVTTTGTSPSLARTESHVWAGSGQNPPIARAALDGTGLEPAVLSLPPIDASLRGANVLASDCLDLFAVRGTELYAARGGAGPLELLTDLTTNAPLDVVADERFLHLAVPDTGGVYRVSKDGTGIVRLIDGDAWRLAVDDEGVYWGEHAKGSLAGNLFMLPK